jgi:hypothetical protein
MKTIPFVLSLAVLIAAHPAQAESTSIEIQKSTLDVPTKIATQETQSAVVIGASSWFPKNLTSPAKMASNTAFQGTGIPALYLNYVLQGSQRLRNVSFKWGAGWLSLSRNASVDMGGIQTPVSQSAQLVSANLGLEFTPPTLVSRFITPYVSASLSPQLLLTGRSSFDDGSTQLGMTGEGAVGTRLKLSALGWSQAELDLSASERVGSIHASSLIGFGLMSGLRVAL